MLVHDLITPAQNKTAGRLYQGISSTENAYLLFLRTNLEMDKMFPGQSCPITITVNNTCIKAIPDPYGVPQGSMLGPLLYLPCLMICHKTLYNSKICHFVNDTAI